MSSNARDVLAAAMGKTIDVIKKELPKQEVAELRVEINELVQQSSYWAGRSRDAALAIAVLLTIWLVVILCTAYRRRRGPQLEPVPLDFKNQKRLLRSHAAEQNETK